MGCQKKDRYGDTGVRPNIDTLTSRILERANVRALSAGGAFPFAHGLLPGYSLSMERGAAPVVSAFGGSDSRVFCLRTSDILKPR